MMTLPSASLMVPGAGVELLSTTFLGLYFITLLSLFVFGMHGFVMVHYNLRGTRMTAAPTGLPADLPLVTVQLPVFNEKYVVHQLIDAVCGLSYPRDKLELQVLDDSTDETTAIVSEEVRIRRAQGIDIHHVRRQHRDGYKAGALKNGFGLARGAFIAVFDADFVPRKTFLLDTLPAFADPRVGFVQSRWEHLNRPHSFLTRVQAFALDAHFVMEQRVRNRSGFFVTFNGTAGIWRSKAILDAGHWQTDTIAEDADIAYRAQLKGWKGVFLNDITSPAELPIDMNSLKAQQFRWAKGTIETARKLLPALWRSSFSTGIKLQATTHLTGHLAFPLILLAGILNAPVMFLLSGGGHDLYVTLLAMFTSAFGGAFVITMQAQKEIRTNWKRQVLIFPLFMAWSLGLAVNNTRAVAEALFGRRSEFVRTPKYAAGTPPGPRRPKSYAITRIDAVVVTEILLAVYCFSGVVSSLYHRDLIAIPFQLLYAVGFAWVGWLSVVHALRSRPQTSFPIQ